MKPQRVAVVQLCVDDRLDHNQIRAQITKKLDSLLIHVDRVILVNEVGGNFGTNFRNTVEVFRMAGATIAFCALLHHDDCTAANLGFRHPLDHSAFELAEFIRSERLDAPVHTGHITTHSNQVAW